MKKVLLIAILLILVSVGVLLAYRRRITPSHSVTLTWEAPKSEPSSASLRYNIYRSDDEGRSYPCVARGVMGNFYLDGSVESGKNYEYVVTVIGRGQESVRSDAAKITVP